MSVIATPFGAGGRTAMKEINVIGTMQLLAACQKAPSLRKLVVKSTTAVYGSSSRDPALFTEGMEPQAQFRSGYGKDSTEVEGYVRGLGRRRPDVDIIVAAVRELHRPADRHPADALLLAAGRAARLRLRPAHAVRHEDDGIEVLRQSVVGNHRGTFNVAGDGVLLLSQAIRRAGRPAVQIPSPAVSLVGSVFRRAGMSTSRRSRSQFLQFGRGVDTTRLSRTSATCRSTRRWKPSTTSSPGAG